jgi:hypothetical protein
LIANSFPHITHIMGQEKSMVDRWNCAPLNTQTPESDGCMVYYVDYQRLYEMYLGAQAACGALGDSLDEAQDRCADARRIIEGFSTMPAAEWDAVRLAFLNGITADGGSEHGV